MRVVFCLCLVGCFSQFAAGGEGAVVGEFGNPQRLVIEGAKTFSPKDIKETLSLHPEFLLAADPDAPLIDCVVKTERLIRAGYRNTGFPDVQVNASANNRAHTISVNVKEGPRYQAGEIRIRGNKAIPIAQLVARLTQPYPPQDALPRSPREGRGKSGTCWVDHKGNNVELIDPVWRPGKPAPFPATVNDWRLHREVFDALADLGFFSARFSVDVVANPATKKADLVIDISNEGTRSKIANVTIAGNKANSREEILKCIGYRAGLPATRDELAAVQERLWRSGRFIKSEVTMFRPATTADGAVLSIKLLELRVAPPLGKALSPEEAIFLKCRDWLANSDRWGGDFVCECNGVEGSFCLVFSPGDGAFSSIKYNSTPEQKPAVFAAIASPTETGLYDLVGKRKLTARPAHGQLVCNVALHLDDNANKEEEGRHNLACGLGITSGSSKLSSPLDLVLSLDPVFFVEMANRADTKCSTEKGVLTAANADGVVRVDAASGRLLDYAATKPVEKGVAGSQANQKKVAAKSSPKELPGKMRFSVVPGEFQRRVDALHAATAKFPNAYVPKRPISSLLRFAFEYDAVWEWLGRTNNKEVRPVVQRMLGNNVCEPLDKMAISYFRGGEGETPTGDSDSFSIPRAPGANAVLEQTNSDAARIASFVLAVAHEAFVPGSWPDAVGRDAVTILHGYGDAAAADLKRIYRSEENGPICFLAASVATAKCNPTIGDLMATRGLECLSLKDFRKDYAVLLDPKCPSGQFLQRVVEFLRDADDKDIKSLSSLLPPDGAVAFRAWLYGVRQNPNQPAVDALPPLLDAAWENGGREYVKTILDAFQRSSAACVPYGSPDNMIANASQAIRIDPKFIRAYAIRGWAYSKNRDYDKAIADYTEAIRLRPDDLLSYYRAREWLYANKADLDKAIADCSEVIRLAPEDSNAYYRRAWAYHMKAARNGYTGASYAESSVEKPSSDSLGFLKRDQDKGKGSNGGPVASAVTSPVDAANESKANGRGAVPSGSAMSTPWGADDKDACLDNAISDYTQAIRLNPKLAKTYYDRGLAYQAKAEKSKAEADFAEARRIGLPPR
jgi:tetratricopeptide (TPR) repeat protein